MENSRIPGEHFFTTSEYSVVLSALARFTARGEKGHRLISSRA